MCGKMLRHFSLSHAREKNKCGVNGAVAAVVFPDPDSGRSHGSDRHGDGPSHPGDHSQRVWQLHHPHHCPPSQHSDELQQDHGHGKRPGANKLITTTVGMSQLVWVPHTAHSLRACMFEPLWGHRNQLADAVVCLPKQTQFCSQSQFHYLFSSQ